MSDKPLTDISFSSFDLHPALLAGLEGAGFSRCTPIQAMTLPVALAGRLGLSRGLSLLRRRGRRSGPCAQAETLGRRGGERGDEILRHHRKAP